ncbi:LOW QUALITY PROTEIN: hypothetical protein TorRG33x02_251480, partial [Trema orientale]
PPLTHRLPKQLTSNELDSPTLGRSQLPNSFLLHLHRWIRSTWQPPTDVNRRWDVFGAGLLERGMLFTYNVGTS